MNGGDKIPAERIGISSDGLFNNIILNLTHV